MFEQSVTRYFFNKKHVYKKLTQFDLCNLLKVFKSDYWFSCSTTRVMNIFISAIFICRNSNTSKSTTFCYLLLGGCIHHIKTHNY